MNFNPLSKLPLIIVGLFFLLIIGVVSNYLGKQSVNQLVPSPKISPTPEKQTEQENNYTCPVNGWQNCMPILSEEGKKGCSKEAVEWYKINCPNFQGLTQ